jgi:oxaloacetate decarboxylase gamma subunit
LQNELLNEGVKLMVTGMGTVFVFLTLLVAAMSLMSRLAQRYESATDTAGPSDEEIAAISVAVARHRKN